MAAPLIAFAAMAAFKVISGYQQGEMIREQNRLRRRIDDMNVEAAELEAFEAEQFGQGEIARYESVIDTTLADQRLAMAGANVDVNYGTALDIQNSTRITGIVNKLELDRQARERAMGFKREARNIRLGSEMSSLQAQLDAGAAQTQGITSAAGTMLSGYGQNS